MSEDRSSDGNVGPLGKGPEAGPAAVPARDAFLSYSSQDATLAELLCSTVEQAGMTCWIAPRNVRPGDVYADAIIQAITGCKIFVLLLSESSVASGHVLREVERACAKKRPIISFRIDMASLPPALEYFLSASHWLDANGESLDRALPRLVEALRGHVFASSSSPLSSMAIRGNHVSTVDAKTAAPRWRAARRGIFGLTAVIAMALVFFIADRLWRSNQVPIALSTAPAAFAPPAHSVAVLPFVNSSGDPKEEYFSDGLSQELLNSLATIRDLRVAARTSSFSFKGTTTGIGEIARKLNVGSILEGSTRQDGKYVRITAQLINAQTGFQLWAKSYDRELKDILKLQAEIATAVTTALQATLLADSVAALESGGTENPRAFDAYLRGERWVGMPLDKENTRAQLAAYAEATRLDPSFAKALVGGAFAQVIFASNYLAGSAVHDAFDEARTWARRAVALAPEFGEAHSALGLVLDAGFQDYAAAAAEYERALALSPGNPHVLLLSARFLSEIGRAQAAVTSAQRAVALDPLNVGAYRILGLILLYTHHYREAIAAYDRALNINPQAVQVQANRGLAQAMLGELEPARQSCATPPLDWLNHLCLAIVLHKLKSATDAQAELVALQASADGEFDQAYQYAQIYAQWGDPDNALNWLDAAYRIHDPGLIQLKVDALLDPIRREPRFQALLAKMRFPD
ncbi:MAG: TIR domain-containing protein [Pseudomonadota bacterium]|nr:TIR domain-containing protein [Pseudomonadota bacterium]